MVKNLRMLRISRGMSQQQLADVIGTSQQSINKYENHNVEPDIATLIKIADHFETKVDFLVGHAAENEAKKSPWLSPEEQYLIDCFRQLSKDEKESIRLILKNYRKA